MRNVESESKAHDIMQSTPSRPPTTPPQPLPPITIHVLKHCNWGPRLVTAEFIDYLRATSETGPTLPSPRSEDSARPNTPRTDFVPFPALIISPHASDKIHTPDSHPKHTDVVDGDIWVDGGDVLKKEVSGRASRRGDGTETMHCERSFGRNIDTD
ncbi:hypothetical protein DM02DRAFT_628206 [Periconia macrospinosa]|uniref:Uncharacterized protein n=1 Tax=Periconia macrospinosa TaxID=97972 RepID=A0A2V1DRR6_9PLEO|nr:hypothetical protein DM02DRAFT_628206 [Periconia macrospinosa]